MKPDVKFNVKAVEKIIESVLKDQLEEEKYDAKATKQVCCFDSRSIRSTFCQMSKTLSTIITSRVKGLGFERLVPFHHRCTRSLTGS